MVDDITESEVSAIRELKTDKSPGTDKISNELLNMQPISCQAHSQSFSQIVFMLQMSPSHGKMLS